MIELAKIVSSARSATSKLVELSARALGDEASDEQSEAVDQVTFLSPLGLFVMPAVQRSLRALVARVGGPVEAVALALWDKQLEQQPAPVAGETRVYGAGWPEVNLRLLNGLIELRVGSNAGVLKLAPDGGGYADKGVARVGDTVGCGQLTATNGGGTVTFTLIPEGGGAPIVSPTLTISGKITSGSSQVKA